MSTAQNSVIKSTRPSGMIVRPFIVWIFFVVMFACISWPSEENVEYHFHRFFMLTGVSAILIVLWIAYNLITFDHLIIEGDNFVFINVFGKAKNKYRLSDIYNFTWNNRPITRRSRAGSELNFKNEQIEIFFRPDDTVTIDYSYYENFDEIKQFLFNYCVENKIITLRPLEERRRSRYKSRN